MPQTRFFPATGSGGSGPGSLALYQLTDVVIDSPTDHDALVYDETTTNWINGAPKALDVQVINNSGASITKGYLCKATGVQGDKITIGLFQLGTDDPKYLLGLLVETLANGATGHVRIVGEVRQIDTDAYTVGTVLYASTTAGQLSSTPGTPEIPVCIVLRQQAQSGRVYVRTWTPGGVKAAGSTGQVQYNGGSSSFAASANLFWDNSNNRLGIGTSSPSRTLDVNGDTAIAGRLQLTATTNNLLITDSTATPAGSANTIVGNGITVRNSTNNTLVGFEAGKGTAAFNDTTAIGYRALTALSTGTENTAVGFQAGTAVTTGASNTFFGHDAGVAITTGSRTTAFGAQAGRNVSTVGVTNNTYVGYQAGLGAVGGSTGVNNTILGAQAGLNLTTGSSNTFLGVTAGGTSTTMFQSVAVGAFALDAATTASNLTAVGYNALGGATTLTNTTAVGKDAALALQAGNQNAFFGESAGLTVVNCNAFTAIGRGAGLNYNASGNANNTFVGNVAGFGTAGSCVGTNNTFIGADAGKNYTSGTNNVIVGMNAGSQLTTGSYNVILSTNVTDVITGQRNFIAIRENGALTSGNRNVLLGGNTGMELTTHSQNILIGGESGRYGQFENSVSIGQDAGKGATGVSTGGSYVAIGFSALTARTTGGFNVAVGRQALVANTTGQYNTAIGTEAGRFVTTGSYNTSLGHLTGPHTSVNEATCIGHYAGRRAGATNLFVGKMAGGRTYTAPETGANNTVIGYEAAGVYTSADSNTVVGHQAAYGLTEGDNNVHIGFQSGYATTTASNNVFIGASSGEDTTTSSENTYVGASAGANSTGDQNTFIGRSAGLSATGATGSNNTATGRNALQALTTGSNNVVYGHSAGLSLTTGSANTVVGLSSGGLLTTGANNVLIGASAGAQLTTESDKLYIANSSTNSPLVYGEFDNAILRVNSRLQVYGSSTSAITSLLVQDSSSSALLTIQNNGAFAFKGGTVAVAQTGYTVSNVTTDRTYNANSTNVDELADVLGTLITDLIAKGIIAA